MGFLPSLPARTNLADVLKTFPKGWAPLLAAHDEILRGPSPLSIAERELIAAYVSGLNGCRFCTNAHTAYAENYGMPEGVVEACLADLESAPVDERLKPVLRYAAKLTKAPESLEKADVEAILAAGWPEEAVADAAMVVALFNFMNRIVMGHGVDAFADYYAKRLAMARARPMEERRAANERDIGSTHYQDYGRMLGLLPAEKTDMREPA
ncbi:MAG: peroxidase [Alphaproteobacteria bacterium]|nr:MAG: peroxidase [Alphaproteobacteria bacterium]